MGMKNAEPLENFARKYVWWKTLDQALANPVQIVAQVMNIGDWTDVCRLLDAMGDEALRDVIRHAEAGMFNERSWNYWHHRLGIAQEIGRAHV